MNTLVLLAGSYECFESSSCGNNCYSVRQSKNEFTDFEALEDNTINVVVKLPGRIMTNIWIKNSDNL